MRRLTGLLATIFLAFACLPRETSAAEPPARAEVSAALARAVTFFHTKVARHGGYVYASSGDLALREGEGIAGPDVIWVQPPGTPAVGEALLEAYAATGDEKILAAAKDAGEALLRGQLESGGWHYSITFDPAERAKHFYRTDEHGEPRDINLPRNKLVGKDRQVLTAGWDTWRSSRISGNQTVLDDDTTQAATRFLCRLDQATKFKDQRLHAAAQLALSSLLAAQYPNGAWSANYDRFPRESPSAANYPVLKASFPDAPPKVWPKDFTGCYVLNDDLIPDMLATLFTAHEVYGDDKYLAAARRAGDFLIVAQLPEPQPAWAQQYDKQMQPVWCRAFEPPAVTGGESHGAIESLLLVYRHTGDKKYLAPIPAALAYLKKSELPNKKLARFYELGTNRPIYFTRNAEGKHEPTYDDDQIASGYGYIVGSKVEQLTREYERVLRTPRAELVAEKTAPGKPSARLGDEVRSIIAALDERGAWVERGRLPHHKVTPESGVITSETFCRHVRKLSDFLRAGM